MTTKTWPEYNQVAQRADGRWEAYVQNAAGQCYRSDWKDPIMAEAYADDQAARLGVTTERVVHWLPTK